MIGVAVAEDLVDRRRDERRIRGERFELFGCFHEGQDPLRDAGAGGLVPGEDEELEEVRVLRVVQALAVDLRVHEARDEIVGRMLARSSPIFRPYSKDVVGGRRAEGKQPGVDVRSGTLGSGGSPGRSPPPSRSSARSASRVLRWQPRIEMRTVIGTGSEISVTQSNSPFGRSLVRESRTIVRVVVSYFLHLAPR